MKGQIFSRVSVLLLLTLGLQACAQWPFGLQSPTQSELDAQHAEFDGSRVQISGLLVIELENVGLYESLEAYYRFEDDLNADRRGAWIGLILPAEILMEREKYNRSFVRVTGTFDDACRNFAAKGAFGMCQGTPGEGTLADVRIEKWLSPPWQRLGHAALPPALVDYRVMDAGWPDHDALVSLSRDWLMAILAKDAEAVLSLEGQSAGEATPGDLPTTSAYYDLFFGPDSRFQKLTPLNLRRQVAVLTDLRPDATAPGQQRATVCFCSREDCTGAWPLVRQDLYSTGPFPYVCTGFSKADGAWRWDFR